MAGVEDKVAHLGLKLLFYSMISIVGYFLMFIFDTVLIVTDLHPGYSPFIYFAWVFAMSFYILSYLSLVMPDWLVKRIKKSS
jgi:hypothetical protein